MNDPGQFIKELFARQQLAVAPQRADLFETFVNDVENRLAAEQIITYQQALMDKWKWKNRLADIQQQSVNIPNGTVGKPYEGRLDPSALGWTDVTITAIEGLEATGLTYDAASFIISGMPVQSGDHPLQLKFELKGSEEGVQQKKLVLIINPDPRSLWKDLASDRNDPYWKEDEAVAFAPLGDKHLVAASKRGRSHANAGGYRDDDFIFRFFDDTGWSLVVVADGAGSAKLARLGSSLACHSVADFFSENLTRERSDEFAVLLSAYAAQNGEEAQKALSVFVYHLLSSAAHAAHRKLMDAAAGAGAELKDLHTTLIFTLFKKHEAGYAVLSFGVGDCPIALLHKDLSEVTLMNWLDVGEFGGGTRFITMPEIFAPDKFSTRFRFKLVNDFSYLILMTDGVYDAKFMVEANLEKIGNWRLFIRDLEGENEEGVRVELEAGRSEAAAQLARWLDFWSPGNHDDRTLAIVF